MNKRRTPGPGHYKDLNKWNKRTFNVNFLAIQNYMSLSPKPHRQNATVNGDLHLRRSELAQIRISKVEPESDDYDDGTFKTGLGNMSGKGWETANDYSAKSKVFMISSKIEK